MSNDASWREDGGRLHAVRMAPLHHSPQKRGGTKYWVEQRLRYALPGDRPLGRTPVLEFLVDVEAASRCSALVGTMDSHGTQLILLRMASRLGAVPPFYSLVAPTCPLELSRFPLSVSRFCSNHTLALPTDKVWCKALFS